MYWAVRQRGNKVGLLVSSHQIYPKFKWELKKRNFKDGVCDDLAIHICFSIAPLILNFAYNSSLRKPNGLFEFDMLLISNKSTVLVWTKNKNFYRICRNIGVHGTEVKVKQKIIRQHEDNQIKCASSFCKISDYFSLTESNWIVFMPRLSTSKVKPFKYIPARKLEVYVLWINTAIFVIVAVFLRHNCLHYMLDCQYYFAVVAMSRSSRPHL